MISGLTGLCLAGPRSQDVLSKLTDLDLTLPATADMTCTQTASQVCRPYWSGPTSETCRVTAYSCRGTWVSSLGMS